MRSYLMNNTGTWVSWERWLWKRLGAGLSLVRNALRGVVRADILVHIPAKRKGWYFFRTGYRRYKYLTTSYPDGLASATVHVVQDINRIECQIPLRLHEY